MTAANLLDEYKDRGFCLIKSFFPQDEVEQIKRAAQKVFINQMLKLSIINSENISERDFEVAMTRFFKEDRSAFINAGKTCQHLISLHRLSLSDKLIEQLKFFGIKTPNICTRPVLYFNSKNLSEAEVFYKSPPHQDWRSMQGSLNAMVVWVPLVDIDLKLGALEVVPESHLLGLLDSEKDEWYRKVTVVNKESFVSVEVEASDALFFSSFLLHQSGDNVTDSIRWSCHFRYNDLSEKTFIERAYPNPYVYAPQQELLTPNFPAPDLVRNYFIEELI